MQATNLKNNFNLFINKIKYNLPERYTLLQACAMQFIDIPRFCYHEQLTIAGNCRMCLIEESKSIKPLASCAINITNNGLKIYTDTLKIRIARQSVLEFLLINHPLDCPICDQGGECDLQDQTIVFAGDRGRFYGFKRSVSDKNISFFVKTSMNRCIHCTRCVRFSSEVSNITNFGVTGRGEKMEIGNYLSNLVDDNVFGNVIDLCPVGALTSKPYSFSARSWELRSFETIDIFDSILSDIRIDTSGNKIMRVLPRFNKESNEEWISDKIRFIYDGLRKNRIVFPLVKSRSNKYLKISWIKAFFLLKKRIINSLHKFDNFQFSSIIGCFVDAETIFLLKKMLNLFGSNNYTEEGNYKINSSFISDFRNNYLVNIDLDKLSNFNNFILINVNLRLESPIINIKLKRLSLLKNFFFYSLGINYISNFFIKRLSSNISLILKILSGKFWLSSNIVNYKAVFLLNSLTNFNDLSSKINYILNKYISLANDSKNINVNVLQSYTTSTSVLDFGLTSGVHYKPDFYYTENGFFQYLVGDINNLDLNKLSRKFSIYQGTLGDSNFSFNLILPGKNFVEKNSSYFDYKGKVRKTKSLLPKIGLARIDWRIIFNLLRYLRIQDNIALNKKSLIKKILNINPFFTNEATNITCSTVNPLYKPNYFAHNKVFFNTIPYNYFSGLTLKNSKYLNLMSILREKKIVYNYNT